MGNITDVGKNSFILDDGTGKIEIASDRKIEKQMMVRVFCSISNERLSADVMQDIRKLDIDLFKKINELYIRAGV